MTRYRPGGSGNPSLERPSQRASNTVLSCHRHVEGDRPVLQRQGERAFGLVGQPQHDGNRCQPMRRRRQVDPEGDGVLKQEAMEHEGIV